MRPDGFGMAWGERGITVRTNDAGQNWIAMPPGEPDVVIAEDGWAVSDRDWILLVFDGNHGRLVLETTHDSGQTWEISAAFASG
jgi:photosystem II stability/assembly factor-like uncharacterized protein